MLRMDEFNKIRKEFHINKKSVYQIAREYNRSWRTFDTSQVCFLIKTLYCTIFSSFFKKIMQYPENFIQTFSYIGLGIVLFLWINPHLCM